MLDISAHHLSADDVSRIIISCCRTVDEEAFLDMKMYFLKRSFSLFPECIIQLSIFLPYNVDICHCWWCVIKGYGCITACAYLCLSSLSMLLFMFCGVFMNDVRLSLSYCPSAVRASHHRDGSKHSGISWLDSGVAHHLW